MGNNHPGEIQCLTLFEHIHTNLVCVAYSSDVLFQSCTSSDNVMFSVYLLHSLNIFTLIIRAPCIYIAAVQCLLVLIINR